MKKSTFLSRFFENKLAVLCFSLVLFLTLFSFIGSLFLTYDPDQIDYFNAFIAPLKNPTHPFGTDDLGRDILARLAYGGRISLSLALCVAVGGSLLGTLLGAAAGFFRGWIDSVICRIIDILMAIPQLALLMVISGMLTIQPVHLALVMAMLGWMGVARLVRGEVLVLREAEFVQAARVIGTSDMRIILKHLLPNVLAPVTVAATLAVANTILAESALSYLGFGVHPPTPTWGNMLQGAQRYIRTAPWLAILPGVLIAITVTCFNFVGDAIREAIDPRLKGRI